METNLRQVPVIITNDGVFGVVSNQFGFSIDVEWFPVQTNSVDTSRTYLSDPDWRQAPHQFYRARLWP